MNAENAKLAEIMAEIEENGKEIAEEMLSWRNCFCRQGNEYRMVCKFRFVEGCVDGKINRCL